MSQIITPKAPVILKGPKVQTAAEILSKATPEQIKALTSFNFAAWAQYSGIEVDSRKFDFDSHRYLLPIYLDESPEIVWQKAAQLGATVYMLLRLLWYTRYHTIKAGLYFPGADAVKALSKDRLTPIINSNPELRENVIANAESLSLKQVHNIQGKMSSLYMLYLGGQATKDSTPLDIIAFDEVRLVDPAEIEQSLERVSHSTYKIKIFMSTAGLPYTDINRRFIDGKQLTWHIKCNCRDGGFVPSDSFPDCICEVKATGEVYLRCPRCKVRVVDPQNGFYLAKNPTADFPSYHVSQLCSRYISPKEIFSIYKRTTNMKEFYNAKLGRPWVDEENQPVNEQVLEECTNTDLKWAFEMSDKERKEGVWTMGVDQHGGHNYVVILRRLPDGKIQVAHLEIIERENPRYYTADGKSQSPFKRLYELMKDYNISICIIDAMPNHNEAQDFARAFPGKVFVSYYGDGNGIDLVKWHDRLKPKELVKRGSKEIKLKWQVTINRYQGLDIMLRRFSEHQIYMPHPMKLQQTCRNEDTGILENEAVCMRFRDHLKRMVRDKESVEKADGKQTGRFRMRYIYAGRDPHFSHAMCYALFSMERARRQPIFVM